MLLWSRLILGFLDVCSGLFSNTLDHQNEQGKYKKNNYEQINDIN